jgi:hypothetical protein
MTTPLLHDSHNDPQTLYIPDWVPKSVAEEAKVIYEHSLLEGTAGKDSALLQRLISDLRMKRVYHQLRKKARDGNPFHPATFSPSSIARTARARAAKLRRCNEEDRAVAAEEYAAALEKLPSPPADPWVEQDLAIRMLFSQAYSSALKYASAPTDAVNTGDQVFRSAAKQLRKVAATLREAGWEHKADKLERLAESYTRKAEVIKLRRRAGKTLRNYISDIGECTQDLFGERMYSTVATVACVGFARNDIDNEFVRQILSPRNPGAMSRSLSKLAKRRCFE